MLTLLFFSFLAGLLTVTTPCVLPLLPVILGYGASAPRRHALALLLGFMLSFTLATVTLHQAVQMSGFQASWLHVAAAAVIGFFGLALLIPQLGEVLRRLTQPLADLLPLARLRRGAGSFLGAMTLGAALGLVWTPCAGPILATILLLAAIQALTATAVLMAFLYTLGAALPLLAVIYGGQGLSQLLQRRPAALSLLRAFFGATTIAIAVAIAVDWDDAFQQYALTQLPVFHVENNRLVQGRLNQLVRKATDDTFMLRFAMPHPTASGQLANLGKAPPLAALGPWYNSQPLSLNDLRGNVVMLDFWTYSCVNCLRTVPHVKRWYDQYKDKGLVVVGIHTPEFAFERDPANVEAAIERLGIKYPVAQDNDYATWRAYGNVYWPAHYLIDRDGSLRYVHFGEGDFMNSENAIRMLLGLDPLVGLTEQTRRRALTPEIYLGYQRSANYPPELEVEIDKVVEYHFDVYPNADEVVLEGPWKVKGEGAEAAGSNSTLLLNFIGKNVYVVISGGSPDPITVELDGQPLPERYFGKDHDGQGAIYVDSSRNYQLVSLGKAYGRHLLRLKVPQGLTLHTFTFGDEGYKAPVARPSQRR